MSNQSSAAPKFDIVTAVKMSLVCDKSYEVTTNTGETFQVPLDDTWAGEYFVWRRKNANAQTIAQQRRERDRVRRASLAVQRATSRTARAPVRIGRQLLDELHGALNGESTHLSELQFSHAGVIRPEKY